MIMLKEPIVWKEGIRMWNLSSFHTFSRPSPGLETFFFSWLNLPTIKVLGRLKNNHVLQPLLSHYRVYILALVLPALT